MVCRLDNPDEPPALIQKSDGTSLYLTRDLARVAYWEKTWHPDYMINVVDVAQSLQLRQVYEVSDKLGLTNAENKHIAFGRMRFSDGGMSTRKGNIILVEEVLSETRKKVREQISSLSKGLNSDEEEELIEILAVNAIKYTILRQNRLSNITFDWENMLSLDGNSAPYLAYTLVRMQSIQREAEGQTMSSVEAQLDEVEIGLLLHISRLNEVIPSALTNFQPSDVANYCYELTRLYNSFYHTHKVIEDDGIISTRLLINNASLRTMENCFRLLGMRIPQKM